MNKNIKILIILCVSLFLVLGSAFSVLSEEEKVRAKIGIQIKSGERIKRAKSRDRLKAGDLLRIYVHPEQSSYVYVVHTDQKTVTLLNMVEQRIQSSTLVIPSAQEFFQVDGESSIERFTVICSPKELPEVSGIPDSEVSHDKWVALEKELEGRSKIALTQKSEKAFAIAGNVRGGIGPGAGDPFVKKLQIFSGNNLLVKKYEFKIKK